MGRADYLALGDWNAVCFQCGFKRKASMMVKNWQGYFVCPEHNEPRQPQDFARGIPDNQTAPWVQPAPAVTYTYTNTFLGMGDGVTAFFQMGSGLYSVTVASVFVNGISVTFTNNGLGGITLSTVPSSGEVITGTGSETMP